MSSPCCTGERSETCRCDTDVQHSQRAAAPPAAAASFLLTATLCVASTRTQYCEPDGRDPNGSWTVHPRMDVYDFERYGTRVSRTPQAPPDTGARTHDGVLDARHPELPAQAEGYFGNGGRRHRAVRLQISNP